MGIIHVKHTWQDREGFDWLRLETPLGQLTVQTGPQGLRRIGLPGWTGAVSPEQAQACGAGAPTRHRQALLAWLEGYFAGSGDLPHLELDPAPGTSFQERVWMATRELGWGQTRTYGEIARAIGQPKATRAVGQALNRNPRPLVVPCHRVLGAVRGEKILGGFAGGPELKRWLLTHEGAWNESH